MKKIIALVAALSLGLTACASSRNLDGKVYEPYGLFDESTVKSDKVCYSASGGNIFWSVVGFETIILPVWLLGYQLYEPIRLKGENGDCSVDAN